MIETLFLYPIVGTLTFGKRQTDPACDEATIEVAMSNNHHIPGSLTFLFPLPMILTNLLWGKFNTNIGSEVLGNERHQ